MYYFRSDRWSVKIPHFHLQSNSLHVGLLVSVLHKKQDNVTPKSPMVKVMWCIFSGEQALCEPAISKLLRMLLTLTKHQFSPYNQYMLIHISSSRVEPCKNIPAGLILSHRLEFLPLCDVRDSAGPE